MIDLDNAIGQVRTAIDNGKVHLQYEEVEGDSVRILFLEPFFNSDPLIAVAYIGKSLICQIKIKTPCRIADRSKHLMNELMGQQNAEIMRGRFYYDEEAEAVTYHVAFPIVNNLDAEWLNVCLATGLQASLKLSPTLESLKDL